MCMDEVQYWSISFPSKHSLSDASTYFPNNFNFQILLFKQALILKLKDPDPNPAVIISVLATIGELAQVMDTFLA